MLLALMVWWGLAALRGDVGYVALQDAADGTERVLSLFEVRAVAPPDRYVLARGGLEFTVRGDVAGLAVGQEWTVGGVFEAGEVIQQWREPAPQRGQKKWLGVLGLAIAGTLAAGTVRGAPGGLAVRG